MSRIIGFSGCFWMIVCWEVGDFICLNQDVQDLRIYRMFLNDYLLGVEDP
jgi:hypothetical protein